MADVLSREGVPYRIFSRKGRLDVELIRRMAAQFRADNIQVVHTHHLCQLIYAGIAARLAGARVVHTEHEFYSLARRRTRQLLRVMSAIADTVTAVAEPVMEFLRDQVRIPPEKLRTIPNGVEVARFQSARPIPRAALGWHDDDVVIGCVARLEPEKGHDVLLDAFRRLYDRNRHARLLFVGDGGERERLAATADALGLNGAARFLGVRHDVPELLATCDVVTLASTCEGLPLVLLEAMAACKPVVATQVGAVPEVVREGQTGLLVPPGDAAALAESLESLVRDEGTRRRLGTQAYQLVQSDYSFDRTLEQYEAVYKAAMTGCS